MNNIILLLGPRVNKENSNITGGVIVLFENLLNYCDKNHIKYIVIDTNKANYRSKLIAYIGIIYLLLMNITKAQHISLHGTANDYLFIAPILMVMARIFHKNYSLRKFAGNFHELFENYSLIKKRVIKSVLQNSSVNFFETKYLVNYFKKYNSNTYWFPNVREKQKIRVSQEYRKKFVFIGLVCKEKGVDVLCEVFKNLSKEYSMDMYGELSDGYCSKSLENCNLHYKGRLKHDKVISILSKYDVLILPSFREGYPGVVIEALSIGMPVIATKLKGIEEMLDENSSVLCEIGNAEELKSAVKSFNQKNYVKMSEAAFKQFRQFDSELNYEIFFQKIMKANEVYV